MKSSTKKMQSIKFAQEVAKWIDYSRFNVQFPILPFIVEKLETIGLFLIESVKLINQTIDNLKIISWSWKKNFYKDTNSSRKKFKF